MSNKTPEIPDIDFAITAAMEKVDSLAVKKKSASRKKWTEFDSIDALEALKDVARVPTGQAKARFYKDYIIKLIEAACVKNLDVKTTVGIAHGTYPDFIVHPSEYVAYRALNAFFYEYTTKTNRHGQSRSKRSSLRSDYKQRLAWLEKSVMAAESAVKPFVSATK